MLLRNIERFRDLIQVTVDHGQIRRFTIEEGEKTRANGFFIERDSISFGLGAANGCLWLFCQGKLTRYSEDIVTEITQDEGQRSFLARHGRIPLLQITYTPAQPHWNFFAMEDEDVDGFVLIHNILASSERKAVFLDANSG